MNVFLIYLAAITAVELATTFFNPVLGIILHAVVLITLIFHAAVRYNHPHHQLLLALTLVPLIRILSFSIPLVRFPVLYWYFIVSVPLTVAAFMLLRMLGLSRQDIGLRIRDVHLQIPVAITGIGLGVIEYLILKPQPLVPQFSWIGILLPALILTFSTGFVEEFIFRGILQRVSRDIFLGWAIPYTSIIFAVLHLGYKSWIDFIFVFLVALFFSEVVKRTGSLLGVTLAHSLTNIMLFLVAPFFV